MRRFIDDLAGAVTDFVKNIVGMAAYFLGGFIIVAVCMYAFMYLIGWGVSSLM